MKLENSFHLDLSLQSFETQIFLQKDLTLWIQVWTMQINERLKICTSILRCLKSKWWLRKPQNSRSLIYKTNHKRLNFLLLKKSMDILTQILLKCQSTRFIRTQILTISSSTKWIQISISKLIIHKNQRLQVIKSFLMAFNKHETKIHLIKVLAIDLKCNLFFINKIILELLFPTLDSRSLRNHFSKLN